MSSFSRSVRVGFVRLSTMLRVTFPLSPPVRAEQPDRATAAATPSASTAVLLLMG
jgi:hypothetical protein